VALAVGGSATIIASLITRRIHRRGHERADVAEAAALSDAAGSGAVVLEEAEPGTELGVA
jgi:hypothetical protein